MHTEENSRTRELVAALERIEEGCLSALFRLTCELPRCLDADQALAYTLSPGEPLALESCHARGVRPGFTDRFGAWLPRAPRRFELYDPLRPERWQRNRPLCRADFRELDRHDRIPFFREVAKPEGLAPRFLRVLVCERGTILGWVGVFREAPFAERQRHRLRALVPALRRRLRFERDTGGAALRAAALPAALEAISGAAFLLGPHGGVREASRLGEAVLCRDGAPLRAELKALASGHRPRSPFSLRRIASRGAADHFLAIRRHDPSNLDDRVARVAARWGLSPTLERVLARVVRGDGNRALATRFGYAEGTVELYVGQILARTGTANRAALLAKFYAEP